MVECNRCNGKYIVETYNGKVPKLLFVSEDGLRFDLYVDGEKVNGILRLNIHASNDDLVTHEVEYLTKACTK